MCEQIALTVIKEPEPGTRPVIMHKYKGALFFRGEEHAPSLSCGQCGEVLVTGIPLQCFATRTESAEMKAKAYPFTNRAQVISGTININESWNFTGETEDARLVLQCPACQAYNDTVASMTA